MAIRICGILGLGCMATAGLLATALGAERAVSTPAATPPPAAATRPAAIPIIELRGDGATLGRQHGRQLREQIRILDEQYIRKWFPSKEGYEQALAGASIFQGFLLPEHRAELHALADAAGVRFDEALLSNCFLDLNHIMACSTIGLPADASPDGVARFGRNLDFASLGVADKHSVLLIMHPKGRYAFAAVSWPGMVGVLSGMNEHGLTLANMEVGGASDEPHAMPYILLYRMVLERCKTVDEAIALLNQTPRQTTNNLMLMDAAGSRAVVEITSRNITVRRGHGDATLISTNHHRGKDADRPGLCSRYDFLHEQAGKTFGRIDVPAIEQMLARVAQGDQTMQSMVFEPANRVIYLSTGAEATKRQYDRIDLGGYFRK